ncbi:hypothetical protein DFQ12_0195 [Sphingobacterium detergens]|uniref:Uncharacterized protein n=1 Tax=Sphingobacterium detergens TaxID=1145106 RepID=A0A420BF74_SPHD1|nr:hypothetical protein DFQ12_0195 [Sphingobacterium detergens]
MLILSYRRLNKAINFLINQIKKGCCITDRSENLGQGSTYLYSIGMLQTCDSSSLLFRFLVI